MRRGVTRLIWVGAWAAATAWVSVPERDGCVVVQDPAALTAPFPRRGEYVGKPACVECHRAEARGIEGGAHRAVVSSPALQGCETCHGPGHAHATDPDNEPLAITLPPFLDGHGQARLCGRCHGPEVEGHRGDLAGYLASGKGCTECHEVHSAMPGVVHAGVRYATRTACDAGNEPVGGASCAGCHPRLEASLAVSAHASLSVTHGEGRCEACHGEGESHARTKGVVRLITRPDRARDGVATCVSCHVEVDPVTFHWQAGEVPLLGEGVSCTTCHQVHGGGVGGGAPPVEAGAPAPTNALCVKCHEPAFAVLRGSMHESLGGLDLPLEVGCGSCHAGAAQHAAAGGDAALVESLHGSDAVVQRAVCAQCHDGDAALAHVAVGSHHRSGVTCLTCHDPAGDARTVRLDASAKCATCHESVAAEFRQPHRHPLRGEAGVGGMLCVDCHEPHGARPRLRDDALRERRCVACHVEYRGPFVFEHQASRRGGCVACHVPHGSSNRRMLDAGSAQQSCLACHADFPAFHDQTAGVIYTNCVGCHTEVHGSQHSRYFFR